MNKAYHQHAHSATATVALFSLSAVLAASQGGQLGKTSWTQAVQPLSYLTGLNGRTFSFSENRIAEYERIGAQGFEHKIANSYSALSDGQEPLGADFEAVWDSNVDQLYEA